MVVKLNKMPIDLWRVRGGNITARPLRGLQFEFQTSPFSLPSPALIDPILSMAHPPSYSQPFLLQFEFAVTLSTLKAAGRIPRAPRHLSMH